MLRKILKITTPIILVIIIIGIGYNSYNKATKHTTSPLTIIPSNAAVILQCNDAKMLYSSLNSAKIWEKLCNINIVADINNQIQEISEFYTKYEEHFKENTLFISFHKVGASHSGILFSSNFNKENSTEIQEINSLLGKTISEYTYNNQSIFELNQNNKTIFTSFQDDIIFYSSNKMLIEDAIRASAAEDKLTLETSFYSTYKTISKSAEINLLVNYNSLFEYTNIFSRKELKTKFCEWSANDISIKQNLITANGFNTFINNNFVDILNNQSAQSFDIQNVIPKTTSFLLSIGFDDTKELYNNKNKLLQQQNSFWSWNKHKQLIKDSSNVDYDELINELENEAGIFSISLTQETKQTYAFFKSKNAVITSSLIQGLILERRKYGDYNINNIKDKNITGHLFGELFNTNAPYFTILNNYFIFGPTIGSLEYVIDNYQSKNTLNNNRQFENYQDYLSLKSNLLFYLNPGKTASSLKNKLNTKQNKKIKFIADSLAKFTAFSIQITNKRNLLLNNINLFYDIDFKEEIKEKWFVKLDTSISMKPQLVYNHFSKEKLIIVQNDHHKVFAINSEGKELWSVQLNSKIIGDISSIDIYKNNKYQYLFNTKNKLYLIDRKGNPVEGFPVKLNSNTAIGHALFDYTNTKKYRILIIGEDNNIYNLNKKGEKVNGWKYRANKNIITNTPKHFKIREKDYILAERENSTTQLLAINGSERVKFKQKVAFNKESLQIDHKGTLYAITDKGELWRAFLDGNTSVINIPELNNQSKLLYIENKQIDSLPEKNNKNLIYTNNNQLHSINVSTLESSYRLSLEEEITEVKTINKLLAVTTNQKLYIYNDYILLEGFPIDSDGNFNIADIDNNGKSNLIHARNGFIYNYEIVD